MRVFLAYSARMRSRLIHQANAQRRQEWQQQIDQMKKRGG